MSTRERERGAVIRRVVAGEMTQGRAAERLGIGVRQVKRLVAAFRARGDRGLVSGRRGKPSNNRLPAATIAGVERALRERYVDFGPTLAAEKLAEHEKVKVSAETVRQTQIRLGLWRPKRRRERRVFQLRERRPRFGELVQIDGSHHAWLEDRGPRLALIVSLTTRPED
jgi:transposase